MAQETQVTQETQEIEAIVGLKEAIGHLGAFAEDLSGSSREQALQHVAALQSLSEQLEEELESFEVHASPTTAGTLVIRLEAPPSEKETSYLNVVYEGRRSDSRDGFRHRRLLEINGGVRPDRVVRRGLPAGSWRVMVMTQDGWSAFQEVEIRAGEEAEVSFRRGDPPSPAPGSKPEQEEA